MKNFLSVFVLVVLLTLCGCNGFQENTDTRFLMDTFVTVTADTSASVLSEAFNKAEEYEKNLSRTAQTGDIASINDGQQETTVNEYTAKVITRGIYFGVLSGGAFDITLCPVSSLWDFNNGIVPERNEIEKALKNVDYRVLDVNGTTVFSNGKQIELGGIAKGFVADVLKDFLLENGAQRGIINMGSSMVLFGNEQTVKIKNPLDTSRHIASMRLKNAALSTSGTYERCFEKDGQVYHHILDSKTGYPVKSDLLSATVIGKSAMDCDALSTICILLGSNDAKKLIESIPNTYAIFVDSEGNLSYTAGIYEKNGKLYVK